MTPRGKIFSIEDEGTVWRISYSPENGGIDHVVFPWRLVAQIYEGESGRSFHEDYNSGFGRNVIKDYFKGKILVVHENPFDERTISLDPTED